MDQLTDQSQTRQCGKHSSKKIEFVQVNDLSSSPNNNLFYCTACINKDLAFKGVDYLLISQIIEEGETNIIQKWPPVNDYSILDQLVQFTEKQDSSSSVVHNINQYFTQLKDELLKKVNLCQKKMINQALELPFGRDSILKQYQEISQIIKLKSLLMKCDRKNTESYERSCREFISQVESQKQQNSQYLSNLLKQCGEREELINYEYPNLIKDQIFSFIDEIDFFNIKTKTNNYKGSSNQINQNQNSNKIMKLIANKSNFCSKNFLSDLEAILKKVNPLLSTISFENMYEQNKKPLDFSSLSQQRFDLIEKFADNQQQNEKNIGNREKIKKTNEYNLLEQIIKSNVNQLNNNLQQQLKEYLIDSYPLLEKVNFTSAVVDQDVFDQFRQLSVQDLQDLMKLIKIRQAHIQQNHYNLSQTYLFQKQLQSIGHQFDDFDQIFRKYPIFDLMKKKENNENQLQIKLTKGNVCDGFKRLDIIDNTSVIINQAQYQGSSKDSCTNCVSDIILEKYKKYIFRFKISHTRSDEFFLMFGLMSNNNRDSNYGFSDNLSSYLINRANQIQLYSINYGIGKHLNGGDLFKLNNNNEIEMRVWLSGQQLEILDYPNYQYKLGVLDKNKNKLTTQNDLKLYISIWQESIKVTLTQALVVDEFPN